MASNYFNLFGKGRENKCFANDTEWDKWKYLTDNKLLKCSQFLSLWNTHLVYIHG